VSCALFIGETEKQRIAQAVAAARAKPTPWEVMQKVVVDDRNDPTNTLMLEQRPNAKRIAEIRREYPSHFVQLGTYVVAISFEQQPTGLMRHLSVSSRKPGMVPNEYVMEMLTKEFGFSAWPPTRPYRVWVEEYKPGRMAINLVELEP
jgi:hypothetical protein